MLTEILLLLFDVSLYYTVFGFWLLIITGNDPSYAGFLLCAAMIVVHALLRGRGGNVPAEAGDVRHGAGSSGAGGSAAPGAGGLPFGAGRKAVFLLLAIPAAGAAALLMIAGSGAAGTASALTGFKPVHAAFMAPAAAYLAYCFYKGLTDVDLSNFRDHFRIGAWILLALLPGVIASSKGISSLSAVAPYLIVMLASGVIQLRNLRDGGTHKAWHALSIAGALGASWIVTVLRMPRLLGRALLLVYHNVLAPVLYGFAIAFAYLFTWLFELFRKLHDLLGIQAPPEQIGDNEYVAPGEEVIDIDETVISTKLFDYIGIAVLAVLIAAALFFVFRRLISRRLPDSSGNKTAVLSRSRLAASGSSGGAAGRLFRPRDPRMAVRWYYSRFLREAEKRGAGPEPFLTGTEIERRSKAAFDEEGSAVPAADHAASVHEIYEIYSPARYSGHNVTEGDVRRMRAALKKLK